MPFWNKPREDSPSSDTATQDAADAVSEIELDFTTPIPLSQEPQPMAMLKRDEISSSPPAASDLNALLGRGSEFEGKLTFEGTVRIDGKFTGSIVTNDVLVVGEGANISAEIT